MAAPDHTRHEASFSIDEFLAAEQSKDLLRFITAGSVDDGKSTLIGRLLYDSRNVYEDQVRSVTTAHAGYREPVIDFARLTDGLRAEREQGITIDVAYRFFSTERRKFIIADTPGHEQYTRNMVTGASTADLAVILVDARKGLLPQSRRHAYIASLLGIRQFVAAINKMDLVASSQQVFDTLVRDFTDMVRQLGLRNTGSIKVDAIPVSALAGDNVVERSTRMPWYQGPTLLQQLEHAPADGGTAEQAFRMPVQRVIRHGSDCRGFAGQIASGTVRRGDSIVAQPSGRSSRVAAMTTYDGDLLEASAPCSIALELEDALDISRGDLLIAASQPCQSSTALAAALVWFDPERSQTHHTYLLKHGTATTPARIIRVAHRVNTQTLEEEATSVLAMNDIGLVELELTRALYFDTYSDNRATGSFILIDPLSNRTLAAGLIRDSIRAVQQRRPALVLFNPASPAVQVLEEMLPAQVPVVRTAIVEKKMLRGLLALGLTVLVTGALDAATRDALADFVVIDVDEHSSLDQVAAELLKQ